MIKFVTICTILALIYFAFSILSQLDSALVITLNDYTINSTLFTSLIFLITLIFIVLIILKVTFSIFGLPSLIQQKLYEQNSKKIQYRLIYSMAQLFIGNKSKSNKMVQSLQNKLRPDFLEFSNLILAESEEDLDKKIQYFKELIKLNDYNYFATKKLAQIFYDLSRYEQSEHYAILAFNKNKLDNEILEILINCYAKLSLWTKFLILASKFDIFDNKELSHLKNKISEYSILATHEMLKNNKDYDAVSYLELALEYNPASIEAIDLYYEVNLSMYGTIKNFNILEIAFASNPSFELMEIYVKSSNLSPLEIYNKLESLVENPKKHLSIFLSIAAYLNLPDKFNVITS